MAVLCARITADDVVRLPCEASSIAEAALDDPVGVYTVARTYKGDQTVLFEAHLDRLEDSARREGIPVVLDRRQLLLSLSDLVREAGFRETRLRLTIPRNDPLVVLATLEPLPPLPEGYRLHGVKAATVRFERSHPMVKSNRLEGVRAQVRRELPDGVYEGLITGSNGELLEGLSSNFYVILDGTLRTADTEVLHGISRRIVLSVADGRLPVVLQPVLVGDLVSVSEAFMSSSSRGIVPVIEIDGMPIGNGVPGPRTAGLIDGYNAWVEANLEPLGQKD
jgi:branched-chain amino acid aminotransferase